jgi:hypothetical protein
MKAPLRDNGSERRRDEETKEEGIRVMVQAVFRSER